MANCSNCGFDLSTQRPLPERCPRCGAIAAPAAPPAFGVGATGPSSTLFGVPQVDDDALLGDLGPGESSGDDLRFGGAAPNFEAEPGVAFDRRAAELPDGELGPPPVSHNEIDLGEGATELELDLPLPESSSQELELDLPMPARGGGMHLPPPPPPSRDLDLPTPVRRESPILPGQRDLPTPAEGRAKGPFDLPPPPPSGALELDLPMPAPPGSTRGPTLPPPPPGSSRTPPAREVDRPAAPRRPGEPTDLPAPVDLELPQPKGARSVTPAEDFDLQPVDFDLPRPISGDELRPSGMDFLQPLPGEVEPAQREVAPKYGNEVQPAGRDLAPKHGNEVEPAMHDVSPRGGQEVEPADQTLAPRDLGLLQPKEARSRFSPFGRRPAEEADSLARPGGARTPSAQALPSRGASRGLVYGGLGVLLVGGAAAGVFYSGVLDEPADAGSMTLGPRKGKQGTSSGSVQAPSPEVVAALEADTPSSYRKAIELAAGAGNPVAQAEAALLSHLRYGPDPVLAGQARALLEPIASTDPHVRRVAGLDALARGDHAAAEAALQGEEARTRLYRGYLWVAMGKAKDARAEAEAAAQARPSDLGAQWLRASTMAETDPEAATALLERAVREHPEHPGLRELLAEVALARGQLKTAAEQLAAIAPSDDAAEAYRGRLHLLRARLDAARGESGSALAEIEKALALQPHWLPAMQLQVQQLREDGKLTQALLAADDLLEAHPQAPQAGVERVESLIASGDGEKALALVQELRKARPKAPELPYLEGKVHAMRLQVEEGRKAFEQALALDPTFYRARLAEARLLADARQPEAALELLEQAAASFSDQPMAQAQAHVVRAEILVEDQRPRDAAIALNDALQIMPSHNDAQAQRGLLRLAAGDVVGGKADLVAVFERTGGYPGIVAPLGRIFAQEGDVARLAELVGDRAEDPQADPDLKLVAARLALLQSDGEKARRLVEEVLGQEPSNWMAHMLLADALRLEGDYEAALERIQQAQPPTPQAELFLLKGKLLEFNGRYAEARPEYQRALVADPDLHEARFLYGRSLAYAGAAKAAIDELSQVIEATGERYPAAYAALGRAQKELGNYSQAIASLSRAVELDPTQYEAWYHEGTIHAFKNQHRLAAEALAHAVDPKAAGNDWYPDAWMRLGRARFHSGDSVGAREALAEYLEIAPSGHPSRGEAERMLRELG